MKKLFRVLLFFTAFFTFTLHSQAITICYPHEWELMYTSQPSCLRDGYQMFGCKNCDATYKETLSKTENHTWGDWKITKAAGCSTTGSQNRSCKYCAKTQYEEIPALGYHTWGAWKTGQKATYSSSGYKIRYCTLCDESETEDIEKLSVTKTQKAVKKTVDNFFSAAKKYNISKIKKCFSNPKNLKLFESKKYMAKFFKESNWDLDYAITSIKVNKKSATVKVKCTYYDYYNVFLYSFDDVVSYIAKNPKASSAQIDKYQYKRTVKWENKLIDYAYDDPIHKTITIKLKKIGKTWKISSYTKSMDNVIHRNYRKAYNAYF